MKKHRPILPLDQYNERKLKKQEITYSVALLIAGIGILTATIIFS